MKDLLKNKFNLFILKGVVFYIIWEILYRNLIIYSGFSMEIVSVVSNVSGWVLDLFYNNVEIKEFGKVFIDGRYVVYVSPDCNALDFIGAFMCFLLAYPAKIMSKVVFGAIMIVFINLFNIIRVVLLTVTVMHFEGWFHFNHHYLFNIVIYLLMVISIVYWVKNYVNPAEDTTK